MEWGGLFELERCIVRRGDCEAVQVLVARGLVTIACEEQPCGLRLPDFSSSGFKAFHEKMDWWTFPLSYSVGVLGVCSTSQSHAFMSLQYFTVKQIAIITI